MTTIRKNVWRSAMALVLSVGILSSCDKDDDLEVDSGPTDDIAEIAIATDDLDSLVVALTEAKLVSTFQGDGTGPFTVFAPTNQAFVDLLSDLKLTRIADINKDLLTDVLTYHVLESEVKSGAITDGMLIKTLQGNTFTANVSMSGVTIDVNAMSQTGTSVTKDNVLATNGVVHIIDEVLVPETPSSTPTDDIVDIATSNSSFDSLVVALTEAELVSTFQGDDSGPFTVFAPTNQAFVDLLSDLKLSQIADIPEATLDAVLKTHVVEGVFQSSQISNGKSIKTLDSEVITFDTSSGTKVSSTSTSGSSVNTPDQWATNGIIHIIDKVLVP